MRSRPHGERWTVLSLLVTCLVLFVTSCDSTDVGGNGAGRAPGEVVTTTVPTQIAAATSSASPESDVDSESSGLGSNDGPIHKSSVDISSFSGILSQLNSYEYELVISFVGRTLGGQAASWELVNLYVLIEDDGGFYSDLQYEGDGSFLDLDRVTVVELNGVSYLHMPDVGCIVNSSGSLVDPYEGAPFLDRVIGSIIDASDTGERIVINGSEARRYVFDVESLPDWQQGDIEVSGEVFVAEDGIPIRVILSAEGQRDFLGQNTVQVGQIAMSLDFFNINGQTTVELPAPCIAQPEYPILADAFDVTLLEELVTYKSHVPLDEAIVFYQEEMADAGWEAGDALIIEGSALLSFSSEGRQVMINVDQDGENEPVVIVISP